MRSWWVVWLVFWPVRRLLFHQAIHRLVPRSVYVLTPASSVPPPPPREMSWEEWYAAEAGE